MSEAKKGMHPGGHRLVWMRLSPGALSERALFRPGFKKEGLLAAHVAADDLIARDHDGASRCNLGQARDEAGKEGAGALSLHNLAQDDERPGRGDGGRW